jgi:hypothetical protein
MSVETDTVKTSKVAVNDITGDSIITKSSTEKYRDNWDRIFGKKNSEDLTDDEEESKL